MPDVTDRAGMLIGFLLAVWLLLVDWQAARYWRAAVEMICATVMLAGIFAVPALTDPKTDKVQLPDGYTQLLDISWTVLLAICLWRLWEALTQHGGRPPRPPAR